MLPVVCFFGGFSKDFLIKFLVLSKAFLGGLGFLRCFNDASLV